MSAPLLPGEHEARARTRLKVSLCLLTSNEIEGCRHDVPRLPIESFDEVFAIDDGSTDGTVEYLKGRGIPVHPQQIRGYNGAILSAFRTCTGDALVLYHPKGSIDPGTVLAFRPLLEQGHDLVVASRIIAGAVNEEDDRLIKPRKWFVIGLGLLTALLWRRQGPMVWDVLHGVRAMRCDAYFAIDPLEQGVSADLEMVVRCYRKRLRSIEFPVQERKRLIGTTHFRAFATGRRLLAYLALELTRTS